MSHRAVNVYPSWADNLENEKRQDAEETHKYIRTTLEPVN